MWGSFKSILGQYYAADDNFSQETNSSDDNDWVIIDKQGNEIEQIKPTTPPPEAFKLDPLPLLDISNTSSPQSSPQLSPTKIEEGWFVAPPPCFTKNSPGLIEISPLEDLLIEHPSMSVYAQVPGFQCEEPDSLEIGERSPRMPSPVVDTQRTNETTRPCIQRSSNKSKIHRSKASMDLKSLMEHAENEKPAQQAKWENDQYKLCPSYMNRQNRVHRYQSRKHHNQKKKSLSKPFAEKGKHGF